MLQEKREIDLSIYLPLFSILFYLRDHLTFLLIPVYLLHFSNQNTLNSCFVGDFELIGVSDSCILPIMTHWNGALIRISFLLLPNVTLCSLTVIGLNCLLLTFLKYFSMVITVAGGIQQTSIHFLPLLTQQVN